MGLGVSFTLRGAKASFCFNSLNLFAKESIGSSLPPKESYVAVNCFGFKAANRVPIDSWISISELFGHVGITTALASVINAVNSCGSEDLKSTS